MNKKAKRPVAVRQPAPAVTKKPVIAIEQPTPDVSAELAPASSGAAVHVESQAEMNADVPGAGSGYTQTRDIPTPEMRGELAQAGNSGVRAIRADTPEMRSELSQAGSGVTARPAIETPEMRDELSQAGSGVTARPAIETPEMRDELSQAGSGISVTREVKTPEMQTELPSAENISYPAYPVKSPEVQSELSQAGSGVTARPAIETPEMRDELPQAGDILFPSYPKKSPEMPAQLPETRSREVLRPEPPEFQPIPLPDPGNDSAEQGKDFSFVGAWRPKGDPLNIGAENYAEIENLRYTDFGLEGVGGAVRVNTNPIGYTIKNGIQLKTNYTKSSYILVQRADTGSSRALILKNETAPPTAGDFASFSAPFITLGSNDIINMSSTWSGITNTKTIRIANGPYATYIDLADAIMAAMNNEYVLTRGIFTFICTYSTTTHLFAFHIAIGTGSIQYLYSGSTLTSLIGFTHNSADSDTFYSDTAVSVDTPFYTEELGASQGRFAILPGGNVGFCDQKANQIWAGEEMPVEAFWTGMFGMYSFTAGTKAMVFTSSSGGPVTINMTESTSYNCDTLATALQTAMNANNTLTGSGAISFVVTNQMGKFKIDAGTGHTIAYDVTGSTAYAAFGFTNDLAAAQTITGDEFASLGSLGPYFNPNFMQDVSKKIQNTATDSDNIISLSSSKFFLIGSTRPISGFNADVVSGTLNSSNLSVKYCDGKKFVTVGTITDGSTMGHVTFTSTVGLAKPLYINGDYLYFYLCTLSSETPVVSHCTANAPIQNYSNLWDGTPRTAIKAELFTTKYIDYTIKAAAEDGPMTAGVTINDFILTGAANTLTMMFEEQVTALRIKLRQPIVGSSEGYAKITYNKNDGTTGTAYIYLNTTNTLLVPLDADMGIIAWEKPSDEEATYYRGQKGHKITLAWYAKDDTVQFAFPASSGDYYPNSPVIDTITGITAHQTIVTPYVFPWQYKNRSMLCGCVSDGELNRIDYSPANSPDVYNGDESSMYDNSQSLRFGGKEAITCALELYNLYGNYTITNGLVFKNTETYLLNGDTPDTTSQTPFKIHTVSTIVGCPAPLTLDRAEVSIGNASNAPQNVAAWVSDKGPVMFYGNTIRPLEGLEPYFEDGNPLCINKTYLANARGCYEHTYKPYHIWLPSSASTGDNDLWFAFDFLRMKWYQIKPTVDFPQGAFIVQDTIGNKYMYGYTATGYLMRLEAYDTTTKASIQYWSTATYPMINKVKTGDIMPTGSTWFLTLLRRIKTLFACDTTGTLTITHYLDGNATGTAEETAKVMTAASTGDRFRNLITQCIKAVTSGGTTTNYGQIGLSHAIKFEITGPAVKPKLMGWGMKYQIIHDDAKDQA